MVQKFTELTKYNIVYRTRDMYIQYFGVSCLTNEIKNDSRFEEYEPCRVSEVGKMPVGNRNQNEHVPNCFAGSNIGNPLGLCV